jgi:hypothetical protein
VTLARILLKLWRLRLWVALGVVFAGLAAAASLSASHSTVYASASTQMLVDSPDSALANATVDLTGYLDRAAAFSRMMTSSGALQYIGEAAGINGNLIDATGPVEINGSPPATHAPVAIVNGKEVPASATYKLSFVQNPSLPTVDVYADAPTTAQAIALANGAVTGFASFVDQLPANNVPKSQRVEIRQLGQATGGMVDASASKSTAVLVFVGVFALWCCIVLFASRLLANLRTAKRGDVDSVFAFEGEPLHGFTEPAVADDLAGEFASAPDADDADVAANGGVNGVASRRAWTTTRVQSGS